MSRSVEARVADVRRLLEAARSVHAARASLAPAIAAASGLTPEGVELGFASLEREATDAELRELVAGAGDAERVHVVLSANVFVAPLRAIAIARAAATHVTVRASPRDPVLARALVQAAATAGDVALGLVDERDVASIEAGEVHVYGRDATIAAIRARARPGVVVRGHGAGMGIAVVSPGVRAEEAAGALAWDVVAFDQRGCLSPRLAFVVGPPAVAERFADALDGALGVVGRRVPRGRLSEDEGADGRRWRDAVAFAGRLWDAPDHAVALAAEGGPLLVPPTGRHLTVVPVPSRDALAARLAPIAPLVVAVGTDDLGLLDGVAPAHARRSLLGAMQRPVLDGPVDRRSP